jgi:hypothetical protein
MQYLADNFEGGILKTYQQLQYCGGHLKLVGVISTVANFIQET